MQTSANEYNRKFIITKKNIFIYLFITLFFLDVSFLLVRNSFHLCLFDKYKLYTALYQLLMFLHFPLLNGTRSTYQLYHFHVDSEHEL